MAIGEFGGAPAVPGDNGILLSAPLYWFYEMSHAALNPSRAWADATRLFFKNPVNPLSFTTFGKSVAAACELFERSTRRYGRPEWRIDSTLVGGERVPIHISTVWERPFCNLIHFERVLEHPPKRPQPRLLIVAPMSGHYASLLRGTVEAFLPNHDVYVTDWVDARMVPMSEGRFDLDDYIDYVISILHALGGDTHVVAVCQPSVPVMAAVAIMEADNDPYVPTSMVLMGGPIDTRSNPTAVNKLAEKRGIDWFRSHVITKVPFPNPGFMRDVYPGFLQLNGFVSMNLDRHIEAHKTIVPPSGARRRRLGAEAQGVLRRISRRDGSRGRILFADRRYRFRPPCAAEGRDDPSRPAGRTRAGSSASRCSPSKVSTTIFPASARPRRRIACASTFHRTAKRTGCSRASDITACSTVRASARRSRRAFPISCCR